MANQNQCAAFAREFQRFQMNFRHQRASGVNHAQFALLCFGSYARRHAMRAEYQYRAHRHFLDRLNENGAAPPQLVHNVAVMHNFVVYVDRRAISLQRQFHDVHSAHHSGAESARPYPYHRLGPIICAGNRRQRQFVLRKGSYFT